ncbi:SDR family NAD(P)-dependent oxidoreductase [Secundilactobacillus kimchicus]|uniref:SDR family NAD(P)-dependent oxidoreductase n=1 Tax=Secundilactobacillus kimchicus TaxID=528209 RepID=UPI0024A9602C|nr:SDR family NAD(P)-dependent oxidoreductase [Secundilactobacillus kimchicus]
MQKAIVITGANSGLGYEATKQIAQTTNDYQIIMACRNVEKAEAARQRIVQFVPEVDLVCLPLDTASLVKVRAFVDDVRRLDVQLAGLICNAGVTGTTVYQTEDGFNNILETNYLGHFLLTHLLMPMMTPDARIINVSSNRHDAPKDLTWPGVEQLATSGKDELVDRRSYSYSKLCMILFTYKLAQQLKVNHSRMTVNVVNPGLMIETGLAKDKSRFTPEMLDHFKYLRATAEASGDMLTDLMLNAKFANTSAKYYDRRSTNPIPSSKLSYQKDIQDELWQFSMENVGLAR